MRIPPVTAHENLSVWHKLNENASTFSSNSGRAAWRAGLATDAVDTVHDNKPSNLLKKLDRGLNLAPAGSTASVDWVDGPVGGSPNDWKNILPTKIWALNGGEEQGNFGEAVAQSKTNSLLGHIVVVGATTSGVGGEAVV